MPNDGSPRPRVLLPVEPWELDGECRPTGPHGNVQRLFFSEDPAEKALARLVCGECPVWHPCLLQSLREPETVGVWAGYDEHDRKEMRKRARAGRSGNGRARPSSRSA